LTVSANQWGPLFMPFAGRQISVPYGTARLFARVTSTGVPQVQFGCNACAPNPASWVNWTGMTMSKADVSGEVTYNLTTAGLMRYDAACDGPDGNMYCRWNPVYAASW
jgi:hypothetical protein